MGGSPVGEGIKPRPSVARILRRVFGHDPPNRSELRASARWAAPLFHFASTAKLAFTSQKASALMPSTFAVAAIYLGLLGTSLVLWAFLLYVGLRWAKVKGVSKGRIVLTTVFVILMNVLLGGLVVSLSG